MRTPEGERTEFPNVLDHSTTHASRRHTRRHHTSPATRRSEAKPHTTAHNPPRKRQHTKARHNKQTVQPKPTIPRIEHSSDNVPARDQPRAAIKAAATTAPRQLFRQREDQTIHFRGLAARTSRARETPHVWRDPHPTTREQGGQG